MKNKSSNRGLSYFLKQRIHGMDPVNMLEVVRLDSKLERTEDAPEYILRWEDDGGQNPVCLKHSRTVG